MRWIHVRLEKHQTKLLLCGISLVSIHQTGRSGSIWCDIQALLGIFNRQMFIQMMIFAFLPAKCIRSTDLSSIKRRSKIYFSDMAVCQNLVPLVNIKIAGKWMVIPLKMVLIGIDPCPYAGSHVFTGRTSRVLHVCSEWLGLEPNSTRRPNRHCPVHPQVPWATILRTEMQMPHELFKIPLLSG